MTMIASLATTHELYAKGNSGKDKPEREKPERDKPEREKTEKNKREKNIKAEDAQKNWGKLKDEYEGLSKSEQKEKKEEIKAEKKIRNEIRKEMEKNPNLNLSLLQGYDYDKEIPNDIEGLVQKLIEDYSGSEVNEKTLADLEKDLKSAGMSDSSIDKIKKSLLKYNENLNNPEEDLSETDSSSEDTEETEETEK